MESLEAEHIPDDGRQYVRDGTFFEEIDRIRHVAYVLGLFTGDESSWMKLVRVVT